MSKLGRSISQQKAIDIKSTLVIMDWFEERGVKRKMFLKSMHALIGLTEGGKMYKKFIALLILSFLPLMAQEDFLAGVRAQNLTLDKIESVTSEDTVGIDDRSAYFYNYAKCSVSPDGRWKSQRLSDGIWITNLESSERIRIEDRGCNVKWSPESGLIAFLQRKIRVGEYFEGQQLYGIYELWICEPSGTNKRRLTSNTYVSEFMWCPDGKNICFTGYDNSIGDKRSAYYIGILNITTGEKRVIDTGSHHLQISFSISPDGKMVAYCKPLKWIHKAEWYVNDAEIFIADCDGEGKSQITETDEVEYKVKWCDDGRSLLVEHYVVDSTDFMGPHYAKILLKKQ